MNSNHNMNSTKKWSNNSFTNGYNIYSNKLKLNYINNDDK
jgi:hypothetical protein